LFLLDVARREINKNMQKSLIWMVLLTLLVLILGLLPSKQALARTSAQENPPTSAQVIEAVNGLRLAYGLPPLNIHPVLMQVAEWEVNAIASGALGHTRPNGLSLGQWLLSLGYPLSGDLTLDGYRSENIIECVCSASEAVEEWRLDEPHLNTMISPNRSDIGAAVVMAKNEWGTMVYYLVLETALQTKSGKMQYDAYSILTALPITQAVYHGDATQAAQALLVPQYIVPVVRPTARPDGDVIHEVKNGQSLWGIATGYGVKIEQIQRLNNLTDTGIYPGQKLLVQKGATQPAPTAMPTSTHPAKVDVLSPTPIAEQSSPTPSITPLSAPTAPEKISIAGVAAGILLLASLLAGLVSRFSAQRMT
jgi:LysM repeat protein/uncharacterized protein YkwD